jgi:hypothetical protein
MATLHGEKIPAGQELKDRQRFLQKLERLRSKKSNSRRSFPTAEEMLRQDRAR